MTEIRQRNRNVATATDAIKTTEKRLLFDGLPDEIVPADVGEGENIPYVCLEVPVLFVEFV